MARRIHALDNAQGESMTCAFGKHIETTLSFFKPARPHKKLENYRGHKVSLDGLVEGSIASRAMYVMRQLELGETITTLKLAAVLNATGLKPVSRASLSSTMTRVARCGLAKKTKKGIYQRA
jgi:hypothetical protein